MQKIEILHSDECPNWCAARDLVLVNVHDFPHHNTVTFAVETIRG
jgi:hypothetical protein